LLIDVAPPDGHFSLASIASSRPAGLARHHRRDPDNVGAPVEGVLFSVCAGVSRVVGLRSGF
jgi:hypothetical protein